MKRISIIFGLILLVVLSSCSEKKIIPLENGNLWIYKAEQVDSVGNVLQSALLYHVVLSDSTINNEKYFERKNESAYGAPEFCINRPDGMYVYSQQNGAMYDYKYPVTLNEKFVRRGFDTATVTSLSEKVSTKAGDFTCLKYETTGKTIKEVCYICPGVGITVKEDYLISENGLRLLDRMELTKYFLN
jgi:hypothetical protein